MVVDMKIENAIAIYLYLNNRQSNSSSYLTDRETSLYKEAVEVIERLAKEIINQ